MGRMAAAWALGTMLLGCGSGGVAHSESRMAQPVSGEAAPAPLESWQGFADEDRLEKKSLPSTPPLPPQKAKDSLPHEAPTPEADTRGTDASTTDLAPTDPNAGPSAETREQEPVPRPLLIYEAVLSLAVFHSEQNLDAIEEMARESGGYLVSRANQHIVVRVPAEKFQASLEAIVKLGDVQQRRISVQDVTAEFTDLQIRIKNALAMRDRLQQLLDKAQKVEEALAVEKQLSRITEDIERMKGKLKLFRELIAFSTISVGFTERQEQIQSRVRLPFPWLSELGLGNLLELR